MIPLRSTLLAVLATVRVEPLRRHRMGRLGAGHTITTYQTNGRVETIVIQGTTAYIGGKFTAVRPAGAAPGAHEVVRNHAAAINLTTGAMLPWNPNANATVQTIAVDGNTVIMGGSFTKLRGQGGRPAGRRSMPTTGAMLWRVKPNQQVNDVVLRSGVSYAGGAFTARGWDRSRTTWSP